MGIRNNINALKRLITFVFEWNERNETDLNKTIEDVISLLDHFEIYGVVIHSGKITGIDGKRITNEILVEIVTSLIEHGVFSPGGSISMDNWGEEREICVPDYKSFNWLNDILKEEGSDVRASPLSDNDAEVIIISYERTNL
jgi:hypothetical protein